METSAEVTALTTSKKRKGSRRHRATVRFTDVRSVVNTTEVEVPKEIFDGLKNGGAARVRYLPSDPNVVRVNGQTTRPWLYKLGGVTLVLASFTMVYFFRRRRMRSADRNFGISPVIPPPIP